MGRRFLAALVWTVAVAVPFISKPDTWKGTHWLFRYEDGVMRRALAGTLLGWITGSTPVSLAQVAVVSTAACLVFAILFAYLIVRHTHAMPVSGPVASRTWWLTGLPVACFATAPGGLRQYLSDMGRFDGLGALLMVVGLLWISHRHRCADHPPGGPATRARHGLLPVCLLLSVLAILVHEAFAAWVVPFLGVLWWWHSPRAPKDLLAGALALSSLVLLTLLVWHLSYVRVMSLDEARAVLTTRAHFAVADLSLLIHFRDLTDNAGYTQVRAWSPERLTGLMLALPVLLPQLGILVGLLHTARAGQARAPAPPPATIWFVGAALSPLALSLLGHDQGRWLAMSSFSVTCLSLLLWSHVRQAGTVIPRWLTFLMLVATVWQIVSGPFGTTVAMPMHPLS